MRILGREIETGFILLAISILLALITLAYFAITGLGRGPGVI